MNRVVCRCSGKICITWEGLKSHGLAVRAVAGKGGEPGFKPSSFLMFFFSVVKCGKEKHSNGHQLKLGSQQKVIKKASSCGEVLRKSLQKP